MFEERTLPQVKMGVPRSLVEGVGTNDAPYYIGYIDQGVVCICPYYKRWVTMLQRVYNTKNHIRYPMYAFCTVAPIWHSFIAFKAWMQSQDWEGKELDKDLLVQGNKVYGPDTCLFVSPEINKLLCLAGNARGPYPIGVTKDPRSPKGRYYARCRFYSTKKHLGVFNTPEEASEAYRIAKLEYIKELAATEPNPIVKQALLRLH